MTPIAIFRLNVARSRALIETHSLLHNKQGKPKTVVSDIMRASVVMVVSAIDAYLHGLIGDHVEQAALLTPPPDALLTLVKDWKLDAKAIVPFMLNKKGPTHFRDLVVEHFADRALQDPSKVEQVGQVLGVTAIWDDIATGMNRPVDDVRRDFAAAVKRRHSIAHEADLDPSGKTKTKKRRLTKVEASALVGQVEAVGNQLDIIFGKKYS